MAKGELKRPVMLTRFTTAKAEEAAELIAVFKAWYSLPTTLSMISAAAGKTERYLLDYDNTPNVDGGIGEPEPWVKLEDVTLPDLAETKDEMRFDLRFSGLRLKTFAEGTCRKRDPNAASTGLSKVTASAGMAFSGSYDPEPMSAADAALYHSKALGRNRVATWSDVLADRTRDSRPGEAA